jgi:hypothetical protein
LTSNLLVPFDRSPPLESTTSAFRSIFKLARRGEAVEDVDRQDDVAFVEQRFGGVEPGGSGANDGNA